MNRRAFDRRDGDLVDIHPDPDGWAGSSTYPAPLSWPAPPAPTPPSPEQVAAWVERLRAGDWSAHELLPAMSEWLAWEPSLRVAMSHAERLAPVAPVALLRELLNAALAEEPDAELRAAMERALA